MLHLEPRHTWNFNSRWNFQFQPGLKKVGVTLQFQSGVKRISFYFIFFSKPLFTLKEKLNLKHTTVPYWIYIYRISVGEKLKNIKRKENIIILKYTYKQYTYSLHINTKKKIIAGFRQTFEKLWWTLWCTLKCCGSLCHHIFHCHIKLNQ